MQNPVLPSEDLAARLARRSLATKGSDYSDEIRRLLEAGREVMRSSGTEASPKVADIVAAAGLSNDAFYRHFASKDALVAAILEDGTERLAAYLAHQMAKADTPEGQLRAFVAGVLSQAQDPDIAATTRAVWWNAGGSGRALASPGPATMLAPLLEAPYRALGSDEAESNARLAAHAVVGALADQLRDETRPSRRDVERITAFIVAAAHP